jgi:predicted glycoside hydrolase/deacetylase ChbG (UPF0249 family)
MIKNRQNLIVSADDFGISETANRNILELVRAGKVDRVSVMSEGTVSPNEIQELLESGVKLDIHLELKNASDLKNRKLKAGVFGRTASFFWKLIMGANGKKAVKKRWEEQIEKFKALFGKYPDGINSHEHVHFFPSYFKIAAELGKTDGIFYIRIGKKSVQRFCLVCFILNCLRVIDQKSFQSSSMETSEFMASGDWTSGNIEEFIKNLPGKTELIFHPERQDEFEIIKNYF